VLRHEAVINTLERSIDGQASHIIARRQPAASDMRLLTALLEGITDLERIGDEAKKIALQARKARGEGGARLPRQTEVRRMSLVVAGMLRRALDAFERLDLAGTAERIAGEAVELLSAPPLPAGTRTILLHPSQLYMQVHESCGHPSELDRAFGTEASYAGTSFLTPDMLGTFRYGSDLCDIVADATVPGGLGTFGWDDEGVAAQRVPLVTEGMFVGYLSSRETAPRIGRASGGAMRADGWNWIPLIRMTNVNLLPRPGMSFDDIVADTDDGLLFETNRSWSIDDRRLNFQFSTEICREVKGGKVGRLFRNGTYTGITYELWRSMDAVGDASSWRMWGTPNCGKGEPPQSGHVGHGVSGARFRDVRVGVVA